MAVLVLPRVFSSCALNCLIGSDVNRSKCMCEVGTSMTTSSPVAFPIGCEAGPSCRRLPVCLSVHETVSGRQLRSQAGAIFSKGRLSSRRCSHGQEFGETSSIWNHQREAQLKASATKDSSQDVSLRTDARDSEVPRPRLITTRSDDPEESTEIRGGEPDKTEADSDNVSDRGRLLKTDTFSSTSEEVTPAKENAKENGFSNGAAIGTIAAGLGLVVTLGSFGAVGFLFKDQLNEFLIQFSDFIDGFGPAGYGLFVLVYAGLELLAIPAIPLTMSAGLLFGAAVGTIIVSIAGTIAATGAFLIARYLARDRLLEFTKGNKKFLAIDKAIGDDGFRVVTLLRLSPLLPFSLGNYLYGLTSVKLGPYILGSWLGMLPGTWAYVSAGAISRTFIIKQAESEPVFSGSPEQLWTVGLGVAATIFAATYITGIAKDALKDIDD